MSTSGPGSTSGEPLRRRKRKDYSLLVLLAGILLFGAVAAATYYVLRPVTLRIAVGPAGSDDEKLIKALALAFVHEGSPVRLTPIVTEGATESIALLAASARSFVFSFAAARSASAFLNCASSCDRSGFALGAAGGAAWSPRTR